MNRTVAEAGANSLAEAGLELVAEQREIGAKRMSKLRLLAALEEADLIELERARHRVHRAQACEREARVELHDSMEDLDRLGEISVERRARYRELLQLEDEQDQVTDQAEREIADSAPKAGVAYIHPDLLRAAALVSDHKRSGVHISPAERDVI